MVRMMQKYQDLVRHHQQVTFARVIRYGIETGGLPGKSTRTKEGMLRNARRAFRAALRQGRSYLAETIAERIRLIEADDKQPEEVQVETSLECQVEFPPLIHREVKEETEALVMQRQSGWISDQTASASLGYDYEQERAEIDKAERETMDRAKRADRENWS